MRIILNNENGNYRFQIGDHAYEYRTVNQKVFSNGDFLFILKNSVPSSDYYNEPSTPLNDPDSLISIYPRDSKADEKFLLSATLILKYTKSEKKLNVVNKILNECLIVDKEPSIFAYGMEGKRLCYVNTNRRGKFHINNLALDEYTRDTFNYVAHKYIKKNDKTLYPKSLQDDMNLLMK